MNLDAAVAQLAQAGVGSPRFDAESLAAHVLEVRRSTLLTASFSHEQRAVFDQLIAERASRVPLQHLVGSVGFRYLDLLVGPGVFIPRPETETVVEAALALLQPAPSNVDLEVVPPTRRPASHNFKINSGAGLLAVDLCAGTGAIALSLAHERPGLVVHAVEADPKACEWLQRNNIPPRIVTHRADATTALTELDGTVDLVVSNPPYVELGTPLDPETADHDPALALWGGTDGLDVIRLLLPRAFALLKPGGALVFEHSDRQGKSAPMATIAAGFVDVEDHRDLTGRDRYVTARKPS